MATSSLASLPRRLRRKNKSSRTGRLCCRRRPRFPRTSVGRSPPPSWPRSARDRASSRHSRLGEQAAGAGLPRSSRWPPRRASCLSCAGALGLEPRVASVAGVRSERAGRHQGIPTRGTGVDRLCRSDRAARARQPQQRAGRHCRPQTAVEGPLAARAFLIQQDGAAREIAAQVQIAPSGAAEVRFRPVRRSDGGGERPGWTLDGSRRRRTIGGGRESWSRRTPRDPRATGRRGAGSPSRLTSSPSSALDGQPAARASALGYCQEDDVGGV